MHPRLASFLALSRKALRISLCYGLPLMALNAYTAYVCGIPKIKQTLHLLWAPGLGWWVGLDAIMRLWGALFLAVLVVLLVVKHNLKIEDALLARIARCCFAFVPPILFAIVAGKLMLNQPSGLIYFEFEVTSLAQWPIIVVASIGLAGLTIPLACLAVCGFRQLKRLYADSFGPPAQQAPGSAAGKHAVPACGAPTPGA